MLLVKSDRLTTGGFLRWLPALICLAAVLVACTAGGAPPVNAQGFENAHNAQTRAKRILGRYNPRRSYGNPGPATEPVIQATERTPPIVFFTRLAVIGLALAGFAIFISYRLFSPSGLFNSLAKGDYVPTQFKSEHRKYLQELMKAASKGGLPLGVRADGIRSRFLTVPIGMPKNFREENPHMLIAGAGGKGKSRLIANLVRHDIEANERAVVVVDSEGGLVDLILSEMLSAKNGAKLAQRIVVLDPVRRSSTKSYDPLKVGADQDPQILANNVVLGFKAIYQEVPGKQQDQWNAQTANILRNAVMLLMANGRTLADLPALLSENDFRDILLQNLERCVQPNSTFSTVL